MWIFSKESDTELIVPINLKDCLRNSLRIFILPFIGCLSHMNHTVCTQQNILI